MAEGLGVATMATRCLPASRRGESPSTWTLPWASSGSPSPSSSTCSRSWPAFPFGQRVRPGQPRVRNKTWPGWILAVLPSRVARAVATAEGKPRLCGKVLVDTRTSPA